MAAKQGSRSKGPILVGLVAVAALVVAFFKCGPGFGIGGPGFGLGGSSGSASNMASVSGATSGATSSAAPKAIVRCQLRLDGDGLKSEGQRVEFLQAVALCKQAGGEADLLVTGEATVGALAETKRALEDGGIKVYVREK